jgi:transketolase
MKGLPHADQPAEGAVQLKSTSTPTRRAFSEALVAYAETNRDFWVLESDIGYSTYSYLFGDKYPDRYFNLGIAELGLFATAAGIAAEGRPVVASGYGVFITMRALEAIRSFICYPNLDVKMLSSHGGITAAIDGVTHQATEDIANMTTLPNMKVLAPADPVSARACLEIALTTPGPVFTRLMRDPLYELYEEDEDFRLGGSKLLRKGSDVTIVSYGDILFQALQAAERLGGEGVSAEVIDLYSIKPYDAAGVLKSVEKTGALVVAENHQVRNGVGYELAHLLLTTAPAPFVNLGLQDTFAESGRYEQLLDRYGLSARHIAEAAKAVVSNKRGTAMYNRKK